MCRFSALLFSASLLLELSTLSPGQQSAKDGCARVHVVYGHVDPQLITIEQARAANSYWTPKPLVLTNTESGSLDWDVNDGLVQFQGQVI